MWTARACLADLTRPVGIGRVQSGLAKTAGLTGCNLGSRKRAGLSRLGGLAGPGMGLLINTADAGLPRCVEPGPRLSGSARHRRDHGGIGRGRG